MIRHASSFKDDMAARWARFVTTYPALVVLAAVLAVVLLCAGVTRLGFNTDYKVFFDKANPEVAAFDSVNSTFSKNDTILFTVRHEKDPVFTRDMLDLVKGITDQAWKIPHATRVDSITNFQHTRANEQEVILEDLVRDVRRMDDATLKDVESIAVHEPELVDKLVSPDGRTAGILVTLQLPEGDPAAPMLAVMHAEKMVSEATAGRPELYIGLTGLAPIAAAYPRASQHDIATLVPPLVGIVLVALFVQMRSIGGAVLSLFVILISAIASFGFAGWAGILLTPPAIMAPLMILTIAIADCLHIILAVGKTRTEGMTSRQAVALAVEKTFWPVVLTSVTTLLGFLALNFSQSPPYRDLGNMGAVGSAVALALSLTLLPGVMAILPSKWYVSSSSGPSMAGLAGWLARIAVTHRGKMLIAGLLVPVLILPLATRIEVNDHIVEYFSKDNPIRRDSEMTLDHLTGIYNVEFRVDAGKENGVSDPAYLRKLEEFTVWLRAQPEVKAVSSFSDTVKAMNRALHSNDQAWYKLPTSADQAAQYVLLYEYSLPYGRTLMDRIDIRKSSTRVVATLGRLSTKEIIAFQRRSDEWMQRHGFGKESLSAGIAVMFSHLSHHNIWAMLQGTVYALLVIMLTMFAGLASVRLGIISVLPNLLPPVVAFGIWGATVGIINTAASMVTVIALGLVVDATIHILSSYQSSRQKQGATPEEAVRAALLSVTAPIVITTVTLMLGFAVLSTSSFRMNAEMGMLTMLMVAIGAAYDLLFLPALILWAERKRLPTTHASPLPALTPGQS